MVIDTFMFYNELDMLEFRLKELNSVVDKFVLVESTKTFVGNDKPLYFEENKSLFKKYLHKIHYVVLSNNQTGNAWSREVNQIIATGEVLKYLNLNDKDIIIAGDIDEIPDANEIAKFKKNGLPYPLITLLQETYYFDFDHKVKAHSGYDFDSNRKYHRTVAAKVFYYEEFKRLKLSIQGLRTSYIERESLYEKGGWHLSFFMPDNKVKEKMENYAHTEYDGDINKLIKHKNIEFEKIKNNKYLPKNYKYLCGCL